jgi:hypothetical protein
MIRSIALMVSLAIVPHLARADLPSQDVQSPRRTDEAFLKQWAQGRGSAMRDVLEMTGPTALLASPAVLDELHLTDEQTARVQATQKEFQAKKLDAFLQARKSGIGHRIEEAERIQREAVAASARAVNQQGAEALIQLLNADQRRRLWQIGLQVEGSLVLAWPPIPDELGLTPAQVDQIRVARDRFLSTKRDFALARDEILYIPQGGRGRVYLSTEELRRKINEKGFAWMDEQVDAARDRANEQVAEILTDDQRLRLDLFRGLPEDVSDLIRPGGGKWRPEEAKKYREDRKAKGKEPMKSDEKD